MAKNSCKARRQVDQMYCSHCGLLWDVSDKDVPACKSASTVKPWKVRSLDQVTDSPIQQAISTLIFGANAHSEKVLREAISLYLGRDDWRLDELAGRGAVQRLFGGTEIYCIDETELVEFSPLQPSFTTEQGSTVLSAARQYRILISERKK